MKRRTPLMLAAMIGLASVAGGAGYAQAPSDQSSRLRASGQAGEQWNGYLGLLEGASPDVRARVNAVNIRRRAYYTDLATKRGVQIREVAATMGCELLATSVLPGQYYQLPDGVWRQRRGNEPVARPPFCG